MPSVSSRIWTRVAVSISFDDNLYTISTSQLEGILYYLNSAEVTDSFTPAKTVSFSGKNFALSSIFQRRERADRCILYLWGDGSVECILQTISLWPLLKHITHFPTVPHPPFGWCKHSTVWMNMDKYIFFARRKVNDRLMISGQAPNRQFTVQLLRITR